MPDEAAYERPYAPAFDGPRPPMAAHWPAPPGGWRSDGLLVEGGASTKTGVGEPVPDAAAWTRPATSASAVDQPQNPALTSPGINPNGPGPNGAAPNGPGRVGPALAAPPLPERSRPKHLPLILSILAGIVVLGIIAGITIATVTSVHRYRQDRQLATVGMDQPVRDGAFDFTANAMQCGVHEIGPPDDFEAPTGQFCVITLTIKNVGTTPAIFADAIQKAYGPDGVWFSSDSEAAFYANPDPDIFFNDINPGNKVQALIVYDIPPSGHILQLEVHENPTTRGAIIKIK